MLSYFTNAMIMVDLIVQFLSLLSFKDILFYTLLGKIILVTAGLAIYTSYLLYLHRQYRHIPSPEPRSFFLGHIPELLRIRKENEDGRYPPFHIIADYWMKVADSDTVVIYFFHQVLILTANPSTIKKISTDNKHGKSIQLIKPLSKIFGKRFLGKSLIMVPDYKTWIPQKKIMDLVFSKNYLRGLVPKFSSIIDSHLKNLQSVANGTTVVPLISYIQNFVLNIVSESLFSISLRELQEKVSQVISVPTRFTGDPLNYVLWRGNDAFNKSLTSSTIITFLSRLYNRSETTEVQEVLSAVRKVGKDLIETRIKAIERGEETPFDALNQLLVLCRLKDVGMDELVDNFYNFLGAGFDTTVNLLHFTIPTIVQYPDVKARVLQEIDEVLEDGTEITANDVSKLTYLEQVLNETLRIYPILSGGQVKLLDHEVVINDTLSIPARTTVMLMNSMVGKQAEYFEDPSRFNPDRFAPGTRPDIYHFFPFGVGPRGCIGKQFAMMEAKMFLARFFQTFNVILPDDYKIVPIQEGLTIKPKGSLECYLSPVCS